MSFQQLNKRRTFNIDQKREILSEHLEKGSPISIVARRNNIHPVTLHQWKRKLKESEQVNQIDIEELLKENKKLKEENKKIKSAFAEEALLNKEMNIIVDHLKKKYLEQKSKSLKVLRKKK